MGYLICDKCGGYYELNPGETAANYDKCDCGGKLRYAPTIAGVNPKYKHYDVCPKCGAENPAGSAFCGSCSSSMKKESKTKSNSGIFNWWDKQEKGTKAALGFGGICCIGLFIILLVSAMGSSDKNSQNVSNNNSDTYSDSMVSFKIPSGWTVNSHSTAGHVIIDHYDTEFYIDIISTSEQDEINAIYADGYYLDNDAAKTNSGDTYKVFKMKGGDGLVYLINKNGKLIEIVGLSGWGYDMDTLINSVQ